MLKLLVTWSSSDSHSWFTDNAISRRGHHFKRRSLGELNLTVVAISRLMLNFCDYINLKSNLTGVSVTASSTIEIPLSDINLLDQVEINSQLIGGGVIPNDINELVEQINDVKDTLKY